MDWLALVGGNHDAWASSGGGSIDPYKLICKDAKVRAYAPDELRITLRWRDRADLGDTTKPGGVAKQVALMRDRQ